MTVPTRIRREPLKTKEIFQVLVSTGSHDRSSQNTVSRSTQLGILAKAAEQTKIGTSLPACQNQQSRWHLSNAPITKTRGIQNQKLVSKWKLWFQTILIRYQYRFMGHPHPTNCRKAVLESSLRWWTGLREKISSPISQRHFVIMESHVREPSILLSVGGNCRRSRCAQTRNSYFGPISTACGGWRNTHRALIGWQHKYFEALYIMLQDLFIL